MMVKKMMAMMTAVMLMRWQCGSDDGDDSNNGRDGADNDMDDHVDDTVVVTARMRQRSAEGTPPTHTTRSCSIMHK